MKPIIKTIFRLTAFSIAMGYMETAVVVYLRKIYYPEGFKFPLVPVSPDIATTEFWREAATIIMLIGIGVLVGRNKIQRFSFFIYCFAVWDIFYYVFLKVLLDWPSSLFNWDILFLIPVPWVGPVIAPCMLSCSMIAFTLIIIYYQEQGKNVKVYFREWFLFISGSLTVIASFVWNYFVFISEYGKGTGMWTLSNNSNLFEEVKNYIPKSFNWWLFGIGQCIILLAVFIIYLRLKKQINGK